jgi:mRNA-degrading endonuclease toxin of MazEF toxin-antitoxin module
LTAARGELWWTELPGLGLRPALVVSADRLNRVLAYVNAARVTSVARERSLPTYVRVDAHEGDLPEQSFILCHDLHTISQAALRDRIGSLGPYRMTEVEDALRTALDLAE